MPINTLPPSAFTPPAGTTATISASQLKGGAFSPGSKLREAAIAAGAASMKEDEEIRQIKAERQAARDKAKAMALSSSGPAQSPVSDQTHVSPEEASSVQEPGLERKETDSEEPVAAVAETPVATPTAPQDTALAKHYAQLARKERELRAKVQDMKAKEQAFAAREAELAAKASVPQFNPKDYIPREQLKNNTWDVLEQEGLTYDQLSQEALNRSTQRDPGARREIEALKTQLNELRSLQDKSTKSYEEQQTKAYEQAVNQIKVEAKQIVASNPDFETIQATGSVSDVVDLITQTYEKEGILLSVEDAAKEVEEYLVEEAIKLSKIAKLRSRFEAAVKPTQAKQPLATQDASRAPQTQQQPAKTLSNSMGSTGKKLSARERAIRAGTGQQ